MNEIPRRKVALHGHGCFDCTHLVLAKDGKKSCPKAAVSTLKLWRAEKDMSRLVSWSNPQGWRAGCCCPHWAALIGQQAARSLP